LPSGVKGSVIEARSREGWFLSGILQGYGFGTTPALRATPPYSGGDIQAMILD